VFIRSATDCGIGMLGHFLACEAADHRADHRADNCADRTGNRTDRCTGDRAAACADAGSDRVRARSAGNGIFVLGILLAHGISFVVMGSHRCEQT
jgi:hypothetical protein